MQIIQRETTQAA